MMTLFILTITFEVGVADKTQFHREWKYNIETVVGVKRFISHTMRLSKESKAGFQAGLEIACESKEKETGLVFIVIMMGLG